ncbi:MAG: hypothetical protein Q4D76_20420, partial [Oscillospiraceae bacterium]|nr:hypothetical protein [Oscillospiraceae bacterium]
YGENTNVVQGISNAEPGYSVEKIFTATNKGNSSVTYGAALEDIVNALTRQEDLVYTLTCTSYLKEGFSLASNGTITGTVDGTCNGVSTEKQFPSTSTMSIMTTNTIDTTHTHAYKLTVTYKEMNVDQSVDMNKTFNAKVNIVDTTALTVNNPYKNDIGTLKKTIIDNAMLGTGSTKLGSEVTTFTSISGENERVLNTAPDDYGTSYYYRGNVLDNYVSFANKTWRIVRINGDGSVRLILDDVAKNSSGTVIKSAFNSNYNDNAYVGYMYGTAGSTTYEATHKNINDSTIKQKVDKWYEDNLKTNYADYLADTLFCNDKTLASNGIGGVTTQLGYGTNKTYYASSERLMYSTGTTSITTSKPTFKCAVSANNTYSRFTVNVTTLPNGNKTNGNLKYPIGLLSADEISYAGAYKSSQINKTYYLYNSSITSSWWLSSPGRYGGSVAGEWYVGGSGGDFDIGSGAGTDALRPSINLKASLLINGGDGTKENPYTLNLN